MNFSMPLLFYKIVNSQKDTAYLKIRTNYNPPESNIS